MSDANAPITPKRPITHSAHGHDRVDEYHWLRDENWRQVMEDPSVLDPDIRAALEAENAYAETMLAVVAGLRDDLFEELKARIKPDESQPPSPDGDFAYFTRYLPGAEYPQYCRQPRNGGDADILLDGDKLAEGHDFFRFGDMEHSPDHQRVAWSEDCQGSELYTIRVADIATGNVIDTGPTRTHGGITWLNDCNHYLYVALNDDHRPDRVYLHRLGDDPANDRLIYQEQDPGYFLGCHAGESHRFAYLSSHASETSEVRFLALDNPAATPVLISARQDGHEYDVTDQGDIFVIRTNRDGAEDFKLMSAPLDNPAPDNWTDLVPAQADTLLRGVQVFAKWRVRLEMQNALPRIVVTRIADGEEHVVDFAEEAYALGLHGSLEYDTDTLRFSYSSPTTPSRIYDYDMASRNRVLVKEQEIPSGHDPANYVTRRLMAAGHDGAEIPMTVLYHQDTPLDGSAPVLHYGYGSYGMSMPASFSQNRFSLVDRGFIYVIAHIRGGMEKGYHWYRDGKLAQKMNTFQDYISAAEHLVGLGWAKPGNIAIHGGSAGGMLVGAAANMRPDLWHAVVAEVPFVDVVTTISDDTLPLTPPEWTEWGNPIKDADAYETMLSYSPYDNVKAQDYPAMLVTAGLTDPRVTYWEPAKWVARLRDHHTGDAPILFQTNMDAGHAGSAGRFDKLKEVARNFAFLLKVFDRA